MTLRRSVADVVSRHVAFEIESIDRMYLNLYVPQLQRVEGVLGFIHGHLGRPIASTSAIAPRALDDREESPPDDGREPDTPLFRPCSGWGLPSHRAVTCTE
jgi:hypothetical protein